MILYFSGTGNSRHVAIQLSEALNEPLIDMGATAPGTFRLENGERLGIIAPIHAWMLPKFVLNWLQQSSWNSVPEYTYLVSVCGEEEGNATASMKRILSKRGWTLHASFTMIMPNNYMIGYKLDSPEEVEALLGKANNRLNSIIEPIKVKQSIFDVYSGKWAKAKTSFINPMFRRFAMSSKPFHVTDQCIRCGQCVDLCPVHTIHMEDLPVWGKECTQCLSCINRCPVGAIEYGKATVGKGRYVHPDIKLKL